MSNLLPTVGHFWNCAPRPVLNLSLVAPAAPCENWRVDLIWIFLAAGAGACIAIQAAANGSLRGNLADARWATFFSICGTFISAILMMIVSQPKLPAASGLRATPWWNWIGGPLGAIIVFSGASLTPKLGAAAFIAAVVAGQLVSSLVLDTFGLLNIAQQPLSPGRIAGAAMVFGGVLLVRYG
jgi:transporter family-2 protein